MLRAQKEEQAEMRKSQMMNRKSGRQSRGGYSRKRKGGYQDYIPDFINSRRDYIRNPRRDAQEERVYEERKNWERQQRLTRFNERFGLDRLKTLATLRSLRSLVSRRDRRRNVGASGAPDQAAAADSGDCFCCGGQDRRLEQQRREEVERVKRMKNDLAFKEQILREETENLKKQELLTQKQKEIEERHEALEVEKENIKEKRKSQIRASPEEKTRDIDNPPAYDDDDDRREKRKTTEKYS